MKKDDNSCKVTGAGKWSLLALFTTVLLTSCGKFSDGSSVWQGGLWILPVICVLGGLFFVYQGFKNSKSGSFTQDQNVRGGIVNSKENIPLLKQPRFWIGAVMLVAALVIVIAVNGDK
jgi:membrane protease YdiL (CAAX protease family)